MGWAHAGRTIAKMIKLFAGRNGTVGSDPIPTMNLDSLPVLIAERSVAVVVFRSCPDPTEAEPSVARTAMINFARETLFYGLHHTFQ